VSVSEETPGPSRGRDILAATHLPKETHHSSDTSEAGFRSRQNHSSPSKVPVLAAPATSESPRLRPSLMKFAATRSLVCVQSLGPFWVVPIAAVLTPFRTRHSRSLSGRLPPPLSRWIPTPTGFAPSSELKPAEPALASCFGSEEPPPPARTPSLGFDHSLFTTSTNGVH